MAKLVVEIVHPIRFIREYKTFDTPEVHVGRGFDNDLILGDAYVSAHHLVIRCEEKGWIVENISCENGIYVKKHAKVMEQTHLESGDEIIIGRTRLRLFSPEYQVSPTKLLMPAHGFLKSISRPANTWSIFILGAMVFMGQVYLTTHEDFSVLKLFSGAIWFLLVALVWASGWAFAGRVIKHKTQFAAQFSLSILFLVLLLPLLAVIEYLGYFLNSPLIESISAAFFLGTLFTLFLVGSLGVATNVLLKRRITLGITISLVIISLVATFYYAFKDEFNPLPMYYASLKPPFAKVIPSQTPDQFFAGTEEIFDFSKKVQSSLPK